MENKNVNTHNFIYIVSFYLMIITLVLEILAYWSVNIHFSIHILIVITALAGSIWLWKRKLSKKVLYLQNLFNFTGAIALGGIVSIITSKVLILLFFYIAVVDVFSFTRKGANTQNAKLMSNPNTLSRLSVCLPVPKYAGLHPIIGVGDLCYYSIITITSIMVWGADNFKYVAIAILLGQLMNMLIYVLFWKKKWYKGIPATALPGLFFILAVILKIG